MKPRHIRTRLTIWFVSAIAVVVLLYSALACLLLLRDLRAQMVRHAIQDIETVEGLLYFNTDGQLRLKDDYHNHPESRLVLERLVEVRSETGEVLFRNELLGNRSLGDRLLPREGEGGYSEREFTLDGGVRVQLVSRRHAFDGRVTIIRVAYSEEPLWEQFQADLIALLLPIPAILVVAGFGGYALASRYMRPIQQMARTAEQITSERLHERLPVNPDDGELADLARVFNTVLSRVEESFDRLQRFTSDASHELRTPLAIMRSVGEVSLQRNGTSGTYRDAIGSMLEETNKLTRLVDTLLTFARSDASKLHMNYSTFAVADVASECAAVFQVLIEDGSLRLELTAVGDTVVRADRMLIRQAVANILHNAIKYTPPRGSVVIRTVGALDTVEINVDDGGPGIPEDHLEKVFERFYRVEEHRSRNSGGVGLGLSIARWVAQAHSGSIGAENLRHGGCRFTIRLPRQAKPSEPLTPHTPAT